MVCSLRFRVVVNEHQIGSPGCKTSRTQLMSSFSYVTSLPVQRYKLHNFADASVTGFGECTYLRAITVSGNIDCSLILGKARVAPTKIATVPKLELSVAVYV